jgi:hypothetical protein
MFYYKIYCGRNAPKISYNGLVTEEHFHNFLNATVKPHYDSFTITKAQGYWKGQLEETFIIEILTENDNYEIVKKIAESY